MGTEPAVELLLRHVESFNHGVRTGDFDPMLQAFADDAVMRFEGLGRDPRRGREAIADAYRTSPPNDEISLLETALRSDGTVAASYAWKSEPDAIAGELRIKPDGGRIAELVVTFGSHGADVTPA